MRLPDQGSDSGQGHENCRKYCWISVLVPKTPKTAIVRIRAQGNRIKIISPYVANLKKVFNSLLNKKLLNRNIPDCLNPGSFRGLEVETTSSTSL